MLVWTSNLGETPNLEVGGNTSTPTSLRVCFEEAEGQKAEVGVILLRSIFFGVGLRDLYSAWAAAPSRFAPFFSSQTPPRGAWFGIVSDSQRF